MSRKRWRYFTVVSNRRAMVQGCVAVAAVVAMSSAAFACTTYRGKVTITDSGPLSSQSAPPSHTAVAEGAAGVHTYCSGELPQDVRIVGTFSLAIGSTTSCSGSQNTLGAGTYDVRVMPLPVSNPADSVTANCNVNKTEPTQKVGQITVNASGVGSGTGYPMPTVLGPVHVCVTSTDFQVDLSLGGTGLPSAPELHLNLV